MRLLSVNVGRPRLELWRGRSVSTAIFKEPVEGRVTLRRLNLDGDRQADLSVHGGPAKAVYAYPSEHYPRWRAELSDPKLSYGGFGENFTTEGLDETTINIGDEFRVGAARVMATQPRRPCFKLGLRFGRTDMLRRFHESRLSGFYFAVLDEGEVGAGDKFDLIRRDEHNITVADLYGIVAGDKTSPDTLQRALEVEVLPESWRSHLQQLLEETG